MKLHIVNRVDRLRDAAELMAGDDRLLLIEDGVYGAVHHNYTVNLVSNKCKNVFCLQEDAEARGIKALAHPDIIWVDIDGFVLLTEQNTTCVTWH